MTLKQDVLRQQEALETMMGLVSETVELSRKLIEDAKIEGETIATINNTMDVLFQVLETQGEAIKKLLVRIEVVEARETSRSESVGERLSSDG
jgi:hypothetical protein